MADRASGSIENCPGCGKPVQTGWRYCPFCNQDIGLTTVVPVSASRGAVAAKSAAGGVLTGCLVGAGITGLVAVVIVMAIVAAIGNAIQSCLSCPKT